MLANCRYTRRVWENIVYWIGLVQIHPNEWMQHASVYEWWSALASTEGVPRKGLRSLILLVNWKIWNERNARIFYHKELAASSLLAEIKDEARLWRIAGAKHLAQILPTE